MRDETLTQLVNTFIVLSGVFGAIVCISLILNLPLDIVAVVFLVAVAAAAVAIALALFDIRKQENRFHSDGRT
jgi:NADH:ubiquinone oxidoreductase subunit K